MSYEPKKLAALRILQVLWQYSDSHHPLSQADIRDHLIRDYDLELERRAISSYLTELQAAGFDIETGRNRNYLDGRLFDDMELRLLADGIMSSTFISENNSKRLLTKLQSLGNKYLKLHVDHISQISHMNKTDNPSVFYSLAVIDDALERGKCVRIKSFTHDITGKPVKGKQEILFSPIRIVMRSGIYYMLGVRLFEDDEEESTDSFERIQMIHPIRLDDMTSVRVDEERPSISPKDLPGFETGGNTDLSLNAHPDMSYLWLSEDDYQFICPKGFLETVRDYFGPNIKVQELPPCEDKDLQRALNGFTSNSDKLVKVRLRTGYMAMHDFALQNSWRVTVVSPESFARSMQRHLERSKVLYEKLGKYYQ